MACVVLSIDYAGIGFVRSLFVRGIGGGRGGAIRPYREGNWVRSVWSMERGGRPRQRGELGSFGSFRFWSDVRLALWGHGAYLANSS